MDERRFRAVLEDITATIEDYGEETVIAAFRTVLDRFNYEVVQRDEGPECEYCDWYRREGVLAPLHSCPHDAPDFDEQARIAHLTGADRALLSAALGVTIDTNGRLVR